MNFDSPQILDCSNFGNPDEGFLAVAEEENPIPFLIKRVYWVYQNTEDKTRGNHANLRNQQVIICLKGRVKVVIKDSHNRSFEYVLTNPTQGLLIPPKHWRTMQFSPDAILLCICSEKYDENDYIKDLDQFNG